MSYQVEALVTFNQGIAFVLDKPVEYTYYKQGNLIIGLDDTCTFVQCYSYQMIPGSNAFGGHKFDIKLDDGKIIHCDGQWWDGGYDRAAELLGEKLVHATYNTAERLRNCYVFSGSQAVESNLNQLRKTYTGDVQGYWAYEANLKGLDQPRRAD
ncbi:hypothetical protein [Paenibacillus polysaccharolyticus]|uniref:hypothetical protein n=1 Tax=Paenibacillus polysaccharolyticus TaxID=582692 RepID=UPI00280B0130|nr:hypothetical protein [Paenibacillus polysaccharolyticus]